MSVVADNPLSRQKRPFLWEPEFVQQVKRRRYGDDNPVQRLGPTQVQELLELLRKQFPQMMEKVISDTIVQCAGDMDSAVQHLSQLKLGIATQQSHLQYQSQCNYQLSQPVDQEQVVPGQDSNGCKQLSLPVDDQKTGQQWADELVKAVTGAQDENDARQRSMQILEGVEKAVLAQGAQRCQRVNELTKENTILKKAVAIQNSRLIEIQTERDTLQNIINQGRKQVKQLEISNYSLAQHLKHATTNGQSGFDRIPDIY